MPVVGFGRCLFDHILLEDIVGESTCLDSHDVAIAIVGAALYDYCLSCNLIYFHDELRFWIKLRRSTYFSMNVYDDSRWIDQFRMDKSAVAGICYRTRDVIVKSEINYRFAVPVEVRVCACLYKLARGYKLLFCSK